jgi:hypothetical protein
MDSNVCMYVCMYVCMFESVCLPCMQGDQMSFRKIWTKCRPTHFLSKLVHNLSRSRKQPKNLAYLSNFQKSAQSKQSPNRQNFAQSSDPACVYQDIHETD